MKNSKRATPQRRPRQLAEIIDKPQTPFLLQQKAWEYNLAIQEALGLESPMARPSSKKSKFVSKFKNLGAGPDMDPLLDTRQDFLNEEFRWLNDQEIAVMKSIAKLNLPKGVKPSGKMTSDEAAILASIERLDLKFSQQNSRGRSASVKAQSPIKKISVKQPVIVRPTLNSDERAILESLERLDLKFAKMPHKPSSTQVGNPDASEESVLASLERLEPFFDQLSGRSKRSCSVHAPSPRQQPSLPSTAGSYSKRSAASKRSASSVKAVSPKAKNLLNSTGPVRCRPPSSASSVRSNGSTNIPGLGNTGFVRCRPPSAASVRSNESTNIPSVSSKVPVRRRPPASATVKRGTSPARKFTPRKARPQSERKERDVVYVNPDVDIKSLLGI